MQQFFKVMVKESICSGLQPGLKLAVIPLAIATEMPSMLCMAFKYTFKCTQCLIRSIHIIMYIHKYTHVRTAFCCMPGVNKNKMIMVTVPDDGGFPSVTLGFVGLYGTLAGMSAKGLTG